MDVEIRTALSVSQSGFSVSTVMINSVVMSVEVNASTAAGGATEQIAGMGNAWKTIQKRLNV